MLIRLTLAENKDPFYMRARDVRTIQKDVKDRLTTIVTTDIMTPTGPLGYRVMETPEHISRMVFLALTGRYEESVPSDSVAIFSDQINRR